MYKKANFKQNYKDQIQKKSPMVHKCCTLKPASNKNTKIDHVQICSEDFSFPNVYEKSYTYKHSPENQKEPFSVDGVREFEIRFLLEPLLEI